VENPFAEKAGRFRGLEGKMGAVIKNLRNMSAERRKPAVRERRAALG